MAIRLATSQFATTGDFLVNEARMCLQIVEARKAGADIVHFAEACLSGYAGHDLPRYPDDYDWVGLRGSAMRIAQVAASEDIWVVFGSAHSLSPHHKPHNSLYIVDNRGELVDRYDKRFCAGDESRSTDDLAHYTPGNHFCSFVLNGVQLGTLICHEYRYPELYREHARRGTRLLLHSFHSGNIPPARFVEMEAAVGGDLHRHNPATTIAGITQLAASHSAAASNNLWISCSNSSSPRSCWGAFVVRPDGVCVGRLENERDGLLITDIDPDVAHYDSTRAWRNRAMDGELHSGDLVEDRRSHVRNEF
jgi:predicted amidohydrolase